MKKHIIMAVVVAMAVSTVHAGIKLSELTDRNATKRRKAFTEWVTPETMKEEYERYERKGKFPIYHESSEKGERRIYADCPDGFAFQIWSIFGEKDFCGKDKELRKDNNVLLTASSYTDPQGHTLYRGVWVSTDIEKRMQRVIRRYSISQAVITDDDATE